MSVSCLRMFGGVWSHTIVVPMLVINYLSAFHHLQNCKLVCFLALVLL
jgi:hypothetical protein